jgi:predicted DsbA family dithiol-disulfide isomerase
VSLAERFAGRPAAEVEARQTRMEGLMAAEGLPYGKRTHTYNSRLAQELGKWAETQERGDAFHDAMFRAYFVESQNIGDIDTLIQIAERVGLPADEARAVLTERRFKAEVDADWQRSSAFGITGVPTFVANGHGVVGAQPYETLERLLTVAGATPRQR